MNISREGLSKGVSFKEKFILFVLDRELHHQMKIAKQFGSILENIINNKKEREAR